MKELRGLLFSCYTPLLICTFLLSLDRDVGRGRKIAVLEPLCADALRGVLRRKFVQIGHEDFQSGLRGHTGVAVDQLRLVVHQVEIEPGVFRCIDHDEIDMVHGQLAEVQRAALQGQKVVPLFGAGNVVLARRRT